MIWTVSAWREISESSNSAQSARRSSLGVFPMCVPPKIPVGVRVQGSAVRICELVLPWTDYHTLWCSTQDVCNIIWILLNNYNAGFLCLSGAGDHFRHARIQNILEILYYSFSLLLVDSRLRILLESSKVMIFPRAGWGNHLQLVIHGEATWHCGTGR